MLAALLFVAFAPALAQDSPPAQSDAPSLAEDAAPLQPEATTTSERGDAAPSAPFSKKSASIAVAFQTMAGLTDDEAALARARVTDEIQALGALVLAAPEVEPGCALDAACVDGARARLPSQPEALIVVELVRVGPLLQLMASASAQGSLVSGSHEIDNDALALGTLLPSNIRTWIAALVAQPAAEAAAPIVTATSTNVAENGGLFGVGVVIAPKVGAGLGSIFLEGAGATLVAELELGYSLPFALPRGRDLQLFTAWSYVAPSSTSTVTDPRVPGGTSSYTLTLHTLGGTTGVLYRFPIDVVDWWRLYGALGLRTLWSWTVIDGEAQQAFGTYVESAFDIGYYGAVGSDFAVGPGAILVELQSSTAFVDRFVLRDTATTSLQLAVGYRFFL